MAAFLKLFLFIYFIYFCILQVARWINSSTTPKMFHWQCEGKWLPKIHSQSCGNMSTQFVFVSLWSRIYFLSVLKVNFIIIMYYCEKSHSSSQMRHSTKCFMASVVNITLVPSSKINNISYFTYFARIIVVKYHNPTANTFTAMILSSSGKYTLSCYTASYSQWNHLCFY